MKYLILFFFLLVSDFCIAQSAPTLIRQPKKYFENPDGDINSKDEIKRASTYWIAFSDRDNNQAFDNPSPGNAINTVNFMDKFFVTGEADDYLELWKWADGIKIQGDGGKTQINPKKSQRIGWIKKEFLLLWTRCLVDKKTQFSAKSMAVINAESLGARLKKDNTLIIYNNPDPSDNKENNNTVKMFSFLYIYKSIGQRVLIGKGYKTNPYRAERDILGWVDKKFLQNWPDRVGLQPNNDLEAVNERKQAGIKASLFDSESDVVSWKKGISKPKPNWEDDTYEKSWIGAKSRLPIFKKEGANDIIFTGFPTPLYTSVGDTLVDVTELANLKRLYDDITVKSRQINIVFVIDAGFGMKNYAGAITNSLRQLIKKREDLASIGEKRNTYKYGAVVFRSMEDKTCPSGDLSIGKSSLTASASTILTFINKEFENEGCSNNEVKKDVNTALLEALKMIRDVNKESIQSNYIFFMGGASGNTGADLETIPSLIAKYDVSLSVFQVKSIADPVEFEQFPFQFQDILKEATKKKKLQTDIRFRSDILFKNVTAPGNLNLFKLDYPATSPIQGNINYPEKGEIIPPTTIDDVLDLTISGYEAQLENTIRETEAKIKGFSQLGVGEMSATVKNVLNRLGKKAEDYDLISKFNGKNLQFFLPAYTTVRVNKLEKPVFKNVIFVSEDELYEMISTFNQLNQELPPAEQREFLFNSYSKLVIAYFGKDVGISERLGSKSIDDVLAKITGLPSSSELLRTIIIDEIKDPKKVSDEKIDEAIRRVRLSYESLINVSRDPNGTMRSASEDGVYYWIPQEYLP